VSLVSGISGRLWRRAKSYLSREHSLESLERLSEAQESRRFLRKGREEGVPGLDGGKHISSISSKVSNSMKSLLVYRRASSTDRDP